MKPEPLNLILLNAGLAEHHADWNYDRIRSPFVRIYYVIKGTATVKLEIGSYELKAHHLYLIPAFTIHSDECSGEFSLYYIHIYESLSNSTSIFEQFQFPFEVEAIPLDFILIERLMSINPNRELERYDPKSYDNTSTLMDTIALSVQSPFSETLETQGILQQLVSRFLMTAKLKYTVTDKRILNSLVYITNNIENDINIQQLTNICCLSPDHFIRLFRKEMKRTPIIYINQKKIERAQSLFIFTNRSVKDIAYQLSFDNVSYFNRLFKKYTGQTPVEYRSAIGNK
jgi:AraC-like DNA-binding protein